MPVVHRVTPLYLFLLLLLWTAFVPTHARAALTRSEEHTSELQSRQYLVCRLLLEKKKQSSPVRFLCHILCLLRTRHRLLPLPSRHLRRLPLPSLPIPSHSSPCTPATTSAISHATA